MRILDLFCGAGGFSEGFRQVFPAAEFVGVDLWDVALQTYTWNIGGEVVKEKVEQLDLSTIGKVDVLIGSPPCQPFSFSNKRFRTLDTGHVEKYLAIRDQLAPKWWVMEEVPLVGSIGEEKG